MNALKQKGVIVIHCLLLLLFVNNSLANSPFAYPRKKQIRFVVASQLECMKCQSKGGGGFACDGIETCSSDQYCFLQELELTKSIPGLPSTYFHGGCIEQAKCRDIDIKSTEDEHGLARLIRGDCCHRSMCNHKKMQHYIEGYNTTTGALTMQPSTTMPTSSSITTTASATVKPFKCQKCILFNSGTTWDCTHEEICGNDEVCFVHEWQMQIHAPPLPDRYYRAGCAQIQQCTSLALGEHVPEGLDNGLALPTRGQCCIGDLCNRKIIQQYKASPIQTYTTTAATASRSATATTPVPKTSTTKSLQCEVCDGPLCGLVTGPIQQCPTNAPYCMNTIVNQADGSKNITKQCVSFNTCFSQWWEGSSDIASCQNFNSDDPYYYDFTCSYCCTVDRCNTDIFPALGTLYRETAAPTTTVPTKATTPQIKTAKCAVCHGPRCGSPHGDAMQLCPTDAPFCINTIVNKADGTRAITKKCASSHTCNTQWWQESSDKHVCTAFNSATTYYSDFTCSYCCTEDGCNNDLFPAVNTLFKGSD